MFFTFRLYLHLNCVLMLNWIVCDIELIFYIKMDLALNNPQRLICHKNSTKQPTNQPCHHEPNTRKRVRTWKDRVRLCLHMFLYMYCITVVINILVIIVGIQHTHHKRYGLVAHRRFERNNLVTLNKDDTTWAGKANKETGNDKTLPASRVGWLRSECW